MTIELGKESSRYIDTFCRPNSCVHALINRDAPVDENGESQYICRVRGNLGVMDTFDRDRSCGKAAVRSINRSGYVVPGTVYEVGGFIPDRGKAIPLIEHIKKVADWAIAEEPV